MDTKKLPVGIQDFEKIITEGYLYVDKSDYIYNLAHGDGQSFFLSRPRRFGKSLFLSALKSYWEGRKDLFEGFRIVDLEKDNPDAWQAYPVFYFDFNRDNFKHAESLEIILDEHLKKWENRYGIWPKEGASLAIRFQHLLEKAKDDTGKRVVILVDEYDKPLLENGGTDERMEHDKAVFKGVFSTLKSFDGYIRFAFLTGVTKFSKVSIFSDLNHLLDITIDRRYAGICGMTEDDIHNELNGYVTEMAEANGISVSECYAELKKMYDGYHFHQDAVGLYNPFSLLTALAKKEFGAWWFETGTPTFLVEKLEKGQYDIRKITDSKVYASEAKLKDYRADNPDPVPLLYQSGYLTITGYDRKYRSYQLGYPNEEVKYGFLESLAPAYLNREADTDPLDIRSFGMDIENGDTDSLRDRLIALYASLPYTTDDRPLEQNFQNVAYLVFTLLGQFVKTEVHSALGRSDIVVETDSYVYIMEFKRDGSADEALDQIEEKGYALPYTADRREKIKIGANFDSQSRRLNEWKVVR